MITGVRLLRRKWWAWPILGVALLGFGVSILVGAHSAKFTTVSGTLKHYYKHTNYFIETGRDIVLNEQPNVSYQVIGDYNPPLPAHLIFDNPVLLTVDQGSHDAVALQALDPASQQAGQSTFRSNYFINPDLMARDRLVFGGALLLAGLAVVAALAYFRFYYTAPSAESLAQVAAKGAAAGYGPRSADVVEYLRTLAAMPDADWQRTGDICVSARMSGGNPAARLAAANIHQGIEASGRRVYANSAYAMAEKLVRAHPRVKDQAGVDMRSFMIAPLATIAAALVVVDVASPDDFRTLYEPMAWVVPYDPVVAAPHPVHTQYSAPPGLAASA